MKKAKKNLSWFYLRCPDILLREVSCKVKSKVMQYRMKGDPSKKETRKNEYSILSI